MLGDNGFERVPTVPTVQSACDRDVQAKAYLLTFGSGGKRRVWTCEKHWHPTWCFIFRMLSAGYDPCF